ncbi:MAG: tRNA (guanosine(46)-N7)-methyltransferase TrmB [Casimicrobiaceae bacterium]
MNARPFDVPGASDGACEPKPIRSYVLRQGRMSQAQKRALLTLLPRWGVSFAPHFIDFGGTFGRSAPVILEIGFGMGETTAQIAALYPTHDFLGIEVHSPGIGALLRQIDELGLSNVRVIAHDAVEVVGRMIPPGSLAGVHVYFPDPWPKKRHHKRRLLKPAFVRELSVRLSPGAYLHAATDWKDYADEILATCAAEPLLVNTAETFAQRPLLRPQSKFEARGLNLGHGVWDVLFIRSRVSR